MYICLIENIIFQRKTVNMVWTWHSFKMFKTDVSQPAETNANTCFEMFI